METPRVINEAVELGVDEMSMIRTLNRVLTDSELNSRLNSLIASNPDRVLVRTGAVDITSGGYVAISLIQGENGKFFLIGPPFQGEGKYKPQHKNEAFVHLRLHAKGD